LGFSRRLPGPIYIFGAGFTSVIVVLIGALLGTYIYGVLKINCLKIFEVQKAFPVQEKLDLF
jgi:hypothetical protein